MTEKTSALPLIVVASALLRLIVRDCSATCVCAVLWWASLGVGATDTVGALLLHGITGLMTVLLGYLAHEWGHLLGAWAARSVVHLPSGPFSSPFLFRFDTARNNRSQFLSMSAGGFIASAIVVAALVMALPMQLLASRIALALTLLGVFATFILEIPPAWKVYRGGAMPGGPAFVHTPEH
jgi:hypothetical protein